MKKNVLMTLMTLMICFVGMTTALAANIQGCDAIVSGIAIDVKIANTVHLIILLIEIVVPILLVVFGMIDLMKGITSQKEDEIKKGQQIFVKRLIAGVLVFFVIFIVKLIFSIVTDGDEGMLTCVNCFLNGATETGECKNR